jgi:hypothetical protein
MGFQGLAGRHSGAVFGRAILCRERGLASSPTQGAYILTQKTDRIIGPKFASSAANRHAGKALRQMLPFSQRRAAKAWKNARIAVKFNSGNRALIGSGKNPTSACCCPAALLFWLRLP